jgi:hypothetical protein
MKKKLLVLAFLIYSYTALAQQGIVFTFMQRGQEVLVKEGDYVKVSYSGYLGQPEMCSGIVALIRDSLVELSIMDGVRKGELRTVAIKDITGFRKFRKSKPALQLLSRLITAAGSIYLFYAVDNYTELTFAEKLSLSIGTGVLSGVIVKGFFPERIRNVVAPDLWSVRVLK